MNPVPLRSGGLKENAAARCRGHPSPSSRPVRSAGAAWARRPEQHTARLPGAVPEPPASGAARSHAFPASVCLAGTRCGKPAMPERASSFPPQQLRNDRRAPRPPRHRRKGRLRTSCPQARASAPVSERAFGSAPDCRGGCGVASPVCHAPVGSPGGCRAVQCATQWLQDSPFAAGHPASEVRRCYVHAVSPKAAPECRQSPTLGCLSVLESGQEQSGGSVLLKTWGLGKRGILGRCYVVASSHRNRTSRLQNLKPMDS